MRYVYILLCIILFSVGWYCGGKFSARTVVREVPVVSTTEVTKTKEVIKLPDGKVVERFIEKSSQSSKTSPQPKIPQYRVGILLPVASELQPPTITASRRLAGSLWLEAEFNIKHKEALIGLSYEF